MRAARVWGRLLGVEKTIVERVEFAAGGDMVVMAVRPARSARGRCGICARRCSRYDAGAGRRRWRALDFAATRVFLEADAPRVSCPEHGVVVAAVPHLMYREMNSKTVAALGRPEALIADLHGIWRAEELRADLDRWTL